MNKDYRNTEYCSYNNIVEMKESLKNEILNKHPRTKILYNKITKMDYIEKFRQIYSYKCAYCGVSKDIISLQLFEVDHFICESSFNGNKSTAGEINNLVLSCKKCNRVKRDFIWDKKYNSLFNVDDKSIANLFYRDEDYSIKIEENYREDDTIYNFYLQLKFYEEFRRLDYLLMNMYGFYNKYSNCELPTEFYNWILMLQKKRNEYY